MHTLLIDNHDSFTFNLYHLLAEVTGREPTVVVNDACTWDALDPGAFDAVVISPGPGRPDRARDVGLSADAITRCDLPLLGICLGHQLLCHVHGGEVTPAAEPVHGRTSAVHHTGQGLFEGLASPLRAVRYHSLAVTRVPPTLEVLARTADGVVMAVRRRGTHRYGVQFHPEAVLTDGGRRLVANFASLVGAAPARRVRRGERAARAADRRRSPGTAPAVGAVGRAAEDLELRTRRIDRDLDPAAVFTHLFAGAPRSFWLDSSTAPGDLARFSYMGDGSGPLAEYLTYNVAAGRVTVERGGRTRTAEGPLLDHLGTQLGRRRIAGADLPFDFDLGYVGYLAYELKAECGGAAGHPSTTPDAALLFADRMVTFDHREGTVWLLALARGDAQDADRWLSATAERLVALPSRGAGDPTAAPAGPGRPRGDPGALAVDARHSPQRYLELIAACQREIRAGESYEICLTNMLRVPATVDPVATYLAYRRINPAPLAALLRFGETGVLSASPERFLRVGRDGSVETRPMKGTAARGATPAEDAALRHRLAASEKDRAENLMVVDLARHDLGRVCRVGSVHVPRLFAVETYATVHQLVSVVRGRLRPDRSAVDAVRAAFPGGSMTGAPKQRTMEIIDRLEGGPRGVYSGALGFFALGGVVDLSMVIRTLVARPGEVTLGVGGGIVALSDPTAELREAQLKAEAGLATLAGVAAPVPAATAEGERR